MAAVRSKEGLAEFVGLLGVDGFEGLFVWGLLGFGLFWVVIVKVAVCEVAVFPCLSSA